MWNVKSNHRDEDHVWGELDASLNRKVQMCCPPSSSLLTSIRTKMVDGWRGSDISCLCVCVAAVLAEILEWKTSFCLFSLHHAHLLPCSHTLSVSGPQSSNAAGSKWHFVHRSVPDQRRASPPSVLIPAPLAGTQAEGTSITSAGADLWSPPLTLSHTSWFLCILNSSKTSSPYQRIVSVYFNESFYLSGYIL